jgi:redox-sensitive bicupin YhaK (pirin superfamily)
MITIRPADSRGRTDIGWLDSRHTFSFGDYHDAAHMGFRALRVINDDRVEPARGFGTHGHRDMEIITYVLEGALAHKDSLGNGETLRPGEVQVMTAGRGIRHSEFNPSDADGAHFYQIWIQPRQPGLTPAYAQRAFSPRSAPGTWVTVASGSGAAGALPINADAEVMLAAVGPGESVAHPLADGRHAWLQVLRGSVEFGGKRLTAGDGVAISGESGVSARAVEQAELMLFDLA